MRLADSASGEVNYDTMNDTVNIASEDADLLSVIGKDIGFLLKIVLMEMTLLGVSYSLILT
jgi:hypothetical protein